MKVSDIQPDDYEHAKRTLRSARHHIEVILRQINILADKYPGDIFSGSKDTVPPGCLPIIRKISFDQAFYAKLTSPVKTQAELLGQKYERIAKNIETIEANLKKFKNAKTKTGVFVVVARTDPAHPIPYYSCKWWGMKYAAESTIESIIDMGNPYLRVSEWDIVTDRGYVYGFKYKEDAEMAARWLDNWLTNGRTHVIGAQHHQVKVVAVPTMNTKRVDWVELFKQGLLTSTS